ncbi:MAG: hypothetical protein ABI488_10870 [Polyangiaceae bacterium]
MIRRPSPSRLSTLAAWLLFACGGVQATTQAPVAASAPSAPTAKLDPEAFRDTRPKPGQATPVQFPTPVMKTLKNGVTLFVVPKHSAVTTLTVVARHGSGS